MGSNFFARFEGLDLAGGLIGRIDEMKLLHRGKSLGYGNKGGYLTGRAKYTQFSCGSGAISLGEGVRRRQHDAGGADKAKSAQRCRELRSVSAQFDRCYLP